MSAPVSTFNFPTTTLFGAGTLAELPARMSAAGLRRPLVVTDAGLLPTRAFAALQSAVGQGVAVFSGVHPNPVEADVSAAATAFREHGCDVVIAFGGGSALDAGKACRLFLKRPDLQLANYNYSDDWSGLAPCICIPTTAGTGSEVGRSSVITPTGAQRKAVIFHPQLLARLVILDPELTVDLPPKLTAATGLDALTHCIESFTSPLFHPLCDGIALEGAHLIIDALPRAFRDGRDLDARGKMLVAAAMGAVAFQKDLGATHSLAHPLSAICGMHHGTANALCLPPVMRFNAQRKPGLYRRVGLAANLDVLRASDADADRMTVEFIQKFNTDLGFGGGLSSFGVKESQLDALADEAFADACHQTNPVPVTRDDLRALYRAAL